MTKGDVYRSYLAEAERARAAGAPINPRAAAAQACLETGYGRHVPPGSNNVLGIKAGKAWRGPVVNSATFEFDHSGQRQTTAAWWRVYGSVSECFEDYGRIIDTLSWFADARELADAEPQAYLEALQPVYAPDGRVLEPGYFTDPKYVDKAMAIIGAHHVPTFDQQYPLMRGVSSLWVNNVLVGDVVRARQVGSKLFVTLELEGGPDDEGDGN